jgi:predicted glycosyltransferase involved in capsule biosynthesis
LSQRRQALLDWNLRRWDICFNIPVILGGDSSPHFNRSRARNSGVEKAKTEWIILADADTTFGDPDSFRDILEGIDSVKSWIIPYGGNDYYALSKEYTDSLILNPYNQRISDPDYEFKIKSWAGLAIMRRGDYIRMGGHDERFQGWGWEDVAFRVAADAILGRHERGENWACHLWHERDNADFGTTDELRNRRLFDTEYRRRYGWTDERVRS